jgi:hypothetical protein
LFSGAQQSADWETVQRPVSSHNGGAYRVVRAPARTRDPAALTQSIALTPPIPHFLALQGQAKVDEVDEVVRELKKNKGFSAYAIMNNDGA